MRRWTAKDAIALAEENARLVAQAINRALKDSHGGHKSGHGDGRQTLNADGTPNSRTVLLASSGKATHDPVRRSLEYLLESIEMTQIAVRSLLAVDPKHLKEMVLPPGAGYCVNPHCGRWVPGGPDRLRSGRCDRCRKHRSRHDGEEWQPQKEEAG